MIIKYFDDFAGTWTDITGATGSTLEFGASGWTSTGESGVVNGSIRQVGTDDPTLLINKDNTGYGSNLVATRINVGEYNIYSPEGIFSIGATNAVPRQFLGNQTNVTDQVTFQMVRQSDTDIRIYTFKGGSLTDELLEYTSFEFLYRD
jgi:hypothetical protein